MYAEGINAVNWDSKMPHKALSQGQREDEKERKEAGAQKTSKLNRAAA